MNEQGWQIAEGEERIYIVAADGKTIAAIPLRPESNALGLCTQTRLKNHQANRQLRADAELVVRAVNNYNRLLDALKAVSKQLECPCRNTTETSHRRDGSVIISSDVRKLVHDAVARAEGGAK